jgi:hypothetical protein
LLQRCAKPSTRRVTSFKIQTSPRSSLDELLQRPDAVSATRLAYWKLRSHRREADGTSLASLASPGCRIGSNGPTDYRAAPGNDVVLPVGSAAKPSGWARLRHRTRPPRWRRSRGTQGAGYQADGDTAMTRRKAEITRNIS